MHKKNIAIILAGGVGVRAGGDIPKQYIKVKGIPILFQTIKVFEDSEYVDGIIVVAEEKWMQLIDNYVRELNITKFIGTSKNGDSREASILNGLKYIEDNSINCKYVAVHDAVRPNATQKMVCDCFQVLDEFEASIPIIPIKDTIYCCEDGNAVAGLLERDKIFAGQTPEGFHYQKYYRYLENLSDEMISRIHGTSELSFMAGMSIGVFTGDENNYKITTKEDIQRYIKQKED